MSEDNNIDTQCRIPDNINDYPDVIPYQGPQKTYLLIINGFKLKDRSKGLEPENREIMFVIPHSVHSKEYIQQITINKNDVCDHFLPLSLYNKEDTFYQLQYKNQNYVKENYSDVGIPRFLLKHQFSKMSPIELADYYNGNSLDFNEFVKQTQDIYDPDEKYIQYYGSEFITWQERRKYEQENPFIYIHYTKDIVNGCEHYYRDAFPICSECNRVVPCRFCHEDIDDEHECDRRKYELMHCLKCNKIGRIGMICEHCNGKVSDIYCNICKTLCQLTSNVKPGYHCENCGVCRVGFKESSEHCFKCNTCYDRTFKDKHICYIDTICTVCQGDLKQTIQPDIMLRCNQNHRMHASCYEKLLNQGIFTCPIDHKIIIDDDQYAIQRGKVYHFYRNYKIKYNKLDNIIFVKKYQCYDCNQWNYDFYTINIPSVCHNCFGINCYEHSEEATVVGQFLLQMGKFPSKEERENKIKYYHQKLNETKGELQQNEVVEYVAVFNDHYKDLTPKLMYQSQYQILQNLMQQLQDNMDQFTPK